MHMLRALLLAAASISLTACGSIAGNVIPNTGPAMEQVYDGMGKNNTAIKKITLDKQMHIHKPIALVSGAPALTGSVNRYAVAQEFRKLPNPELTLYVFPHLAGADQVPVPGYYTVFNAYERDHYALPQEIARG